MIMDAINNRIGDLPRGVMDRLRQLIESFNLDADLYLIPGDPLQDRSKAMRQFLKQD